MATQNGSTTFPIAANFAFRVMDLLRIPRSVTLSEDILKVKFGLVSQALTANAVEKITVEPVHWWGLGWKWDPFHSVITYAGSTAKGAVCLHFKEKTPIQLVYGVNIPTCTLCMTLEDPQTFISAMKDKIPTVTVEDKTSAPKQ